MAKIKVKHPYVTQKRGVQGGSPIVAGSRIPIRTIIIYYKQGKDIDEIIDLYPRLTPAQVYDVLSYYYDHQEEIEKEIALIQDEGRWKKRYPPGKGKR
jgi:uncharacterized protein (DUF433 family)